MHLINLTPHDVVIFGQTPHDAPEMNELVRLHKSPNPARVTMTEARVGEVGGVPVFQAEVGETTNLPTPNGCFWIVSRVVAEANPSRGDLLIPHHTVRDSKGRIIGCKSLARV